ncbi:DUF5126 domain-containing protein [Zhouia spongiae]|uniref:DUF5126 domain-containing protein n=1 Tax=Zhouia spongiae TaxID=2202721 RepID=A0ABY3YI05_9FLAO|nr:DUF5000 domain-containing lipoprotein [Zhouia spongiae]UNY97485.1 DUF5126 domain-containing protein [Zhouia spongiae]
MKRKVFFKKQIFVVMMGIVATVCIISCDEEIVNEPPVTGKEPQPVTNVNFTAKPGGVILNYNIQDDATDYVLAEYEIRSGVIRQEKVSKYKNTMSLQGFASEGIHKVTLYSVNISEKRSEPTTIDVEVMEPPYVTAFETLNIKEDFGGLNVSLSNQAKEVLSIEILTTDENGEQYSRIVHNTSQQVVNFSERGFEPEERKFWVTMRDNYGNTTDTVAVKLTPLFEKLLDRTLMGEHVLPSDYGYDHAWHTWSGISPRAPRFLFDGVSTHTDNVLHSIPGSGIPMHFTIDLGVTSALSRFRIWQRNRSVEYYAGGNPRAFELWGSANPDPDGSWDSWTKIGTYTIEKPSGAPLGTNTSEDLEVLRAGHEFNVPIEVGPVRYIRFKTLETWGKIEHVSFAELAFWGSEE